MLNVAVDIGQTFIAERLVAHITSHFDKLIKENLPDLLEEHCQDENVKNKLIPTLIST